MNEQVGAVASRGRRRFLEAGAAAVGASLLAPLIGSARAQTPAPATQATRSGPNILFVFTDQERFADRWPTGLSLPGHERLQQKGVTFTNHQCPATMCTSSRSVLLTGLQTADNGMYENLDVPWMQSLSLDHPTIGHMLRKAGYYTAYKGKWHLQPRVRHQVGRAVHDAQHGEVRLRRQFLAGRPDRPHAGRLQLRPHHRRQRDQLAAHQGPAARPTTASRGACS